MSPKDDDPSSNIFIRFKHHVDAHIAAGLNLITTSESDSSSAHHSRPASAPPAHTSTAAAPHHHLHHSFPQQSSARQDTKSETMDIPPVPDSSHNRLQALTLSFQYSPVFLRNMPQPRPNDLPSHLDASVFTFEDAFEDLLALHARQQLPDITQKYEQRTFLKQLFPRGEPQFYWLQRLRSQGLIPEQPPSPNKVIDNDIGVSNILRLVEEELAKMSPEVRQKVDEVSTAVNGLFETSLRDFINQSRKRLGENGDGDGDGDRGVEVFGNDKRVRTSEPRHFDDLFDAVDQTLDNSLGKAATARHGDTWETFLKSINEHQPQRTASQRPFQDDHESPRESNLLSQPAHGEPQTVTRNKYVDVFGYTHEKVVTKTLDSDGNETGNSTSYHIRPATEEEKTQSRDEGRKEDWSSGGGDRDRNEWANEETGGKDKKGWFWK